MSQRHLIIIRSSNEKKTILFFTKFITHFKAQEALKVERNKRKSTFPNLELINYVKGNIKALSLDKKLQFHQGHNNHLDFCEDTAGGSLLHNRI